MFTKIYWVFGVFIFIALVVFAAAMILVVREPTVPAWHAPVVWGAFGVIAVSVLVLVVAQCLELWERPAKEKREEEDEATAEETMEQLAAVGAVTEVAAGEGIPEAHADLGGEAFEAGDDEPFGDHTVADQAPADDATGGHDETLADETIDFGSMGDSHVGGSGIGGSGIGGKSDVDLLDLDKLD